MISHRADILDVTREHEKTKQEQDAVRRKEFLLDYPLDTLEDNPNINAIIEDAVSKTIHEIESDYGSIFFEVDVKELEFKSRDGFWSHIDGGYEAVGFTDVSSFSSSGGRPLNKKLRKEIEDLEAQGYEDGKERFMRDHASEIKELKIPPKKINYQDLYAINQGALAERLSECESNAMDYALVFYIKVFYYSPTNRHKSSRAKKPSLYIQAGVRESVDFEALNKEFSFTSLTELKTKLDSCMQVIKKVLA